MEDLTLFAENWQRTLIDLNPYHSTKLGDAKVSKLENVVIFDIPDSLNEIIHFHFHLISIGECKVSVNLNFWVYHPSKNTVSEIAIQNIERDEVNEILDLLKRAGRRNANRFYEVIKIKF